MLGCTRSSLNVIAAEKGVVVGRLIFSDNGDMIDCTKMGMGGKAIAPQKNLNTSMDRINEVVIMVGIRYAGEQFKLCLAIANDDEVHEP